MSTLKQTLRSSPELKYSCKSKSSKIVLVASLIVALNLYDLHMCLAKTLLIALHLYKYNTFHPKSESYLIAACRETIM